MVRLTRQVVSTRRKLVIRILLLVIIFVFSFIAKLLSDLPSTPSNLIDSGKKFVLIKVKEHLVDTKICQIPRLDISDDDDKWRKADTKWTVDKFPDCKNETKFSYLVFNEKYLELDEDFARDKYCILYKLSSTGWSTALRKLSPDELASIENLEMFYTKCKNSFNFHVTLPVTPEVQSKMDFWSHHRRLHQAREDDMPLNILFFGFDTVSRSHLHRSLPKTVKLLKEMDFVDFGGFHTLSSNTRVNMAAFTMGFVSCLNCSMVFIRNKNKNTCSLHIDRFMDDCPMIFHDFSRHKYVTLYMDNEMFETSPLLVESPISDFYVQPFFQIITHIRHEHNPKLLECVSRETGPQFMLRYNKRFIKKFQTAPFLGFTWFARPFNVHSSSLQSYDEDFAKFFKFLQSKPKILNKTLIVISGNYGGGDGEEFSDNNNKFEKSRRRQKLLPPLFIRVPEFLEKKYPNLKIKQNLHINSHLLTSPFDVHHTFLHILNLTNMTDHQHDLNQFEPILGDRSSLFSVIHENRTCATFHVSDEPEFCACN